MEKTLTNEFEVILMEKEWFSKYADYNKITAQSQSGLKGIIEDNKKMEVFCTPKHFKHVMGKKDFFDSKNTKELCRSGLPYFNIKEFLHKMFNTANELDDSFKLKFDKVFKERDRTKLGNYVPFFTGYDSFELSVPVHYLNDAGV